MILKSDYSALVIIGNWNNSILNPQWIAKYVLPDTELNVEIPLNINASMRMSTDELRIFAIDGKLNFIIIKNEDKHHLVLILFLKVKQQNH
jgi:hypothetical protein